MPKGNCQFNGSGGQYFVTVIIHLIILGTITLGLYSAWAWVKILRLKASHTTINGKPVTFTGTGGQLLVLIIIQGLLTIVTLGFYFPWAICQFFSWRVQNTLVGGKPGQFTGTGGSLFLFYLIHLMILPIITLGLYYFWGLYKFYAWKEEHTKFGGEKTSFGAGFGGFLKVSLISYILYVITLGLFTPWAMCMLFKWQTEGLAVGDGEEVKHFPPVKTNIIVVVVLILIGLLPFVAIGFFAWKHYENLQKMKVQMEQRQRIEALKKRTAVKRPIQRPSPRVAPKPVETPAVKPLPQPAKAPSRPLPEEKPAPEQKIDYASELKQINNLIKLDNKNADAFYNRGWLYAGKGDLQKAEKDYARAIQINKRHGDAYYNRGLVFVKMKKFEQAARDFSEAIKLKSRASDAYCNRANANFQLGKTDLAINDYSAALKINPNDGDLYYNRAIAYLAKGEKPKAMADFQKAAKLEHDKAREYLKMPTAKTKIPAKTSDASRSMDLKKIKIPASKVSGKINGKNFIVENAKIGRGILTLRQGKDFFPDRGVIIFLFLKENEKADSKIFDISKDSGFGVPHIHMQWMQEGEKVPKTKIFSKNYAMRLEFGKKEMDSLPGKIYLSLPDEFQSSIAGTFIAEVKEK